MSELAYRALSLVISKHACCLGSYAADKPARLCRAYELVEESEDRVLYLYSIRGDLQEIAPLRRAVVERIRRFAPELLPVPDSRPNPTPFCCLTIVHVRRLYMKRVRDDARNKRRRIKRWLPVRLATENVYCRMLARCILVFRAVGLFNIIIQFIIVLFHIYCRTFRTYCALLLTLLFYCVLYWLFIVFYWVRIVFFIDFALFFMDFTLIFWLFFIDFALIFYCFYWFVIDFHCFLLIFHSLGVVRRR
jgi:hypothetical protein